ncbi:MAG: hypothetical protein MUF21_07750, partial [Gemmatimonadaceae bacterium]|nr:hypothetical protein [Gemmatimonadaceae bacterium]
LLNTAVQPYNESIFFCLFAITVALYLRWYDAPSWGRALLVGVVGGVGILTRESLLAPLVALAALAPLVVPRARARAAVQGGTMVVAAALVILPWSLHNSAQLGTTVPVSAISGSVLGMGNNACTAAEPLGQPFYGDNPCPALDSARAAPLAALSAQGLPYMVAFDRATGAAGAAFITAHPTDYVRLSLRRAWTTFLPKHPRQPLGVAQTAILAAYIAVTVIPGVVALALLARRGVREAWMLGLTFLAMYAPLVLIFVSHDHRFRVGMDVVAACGAGAAWAWVARRMLGRPVAAAVRG